MKSEKIIFVKIVKPANFNLKKCISSNLKKIQNFGIIKKQVHAMHILNVNTVNFAVNRKENDIL